MFDDLLCRAAGSERSRSGWTRAVPLRSASWCAAAISMCWASSRSLGRLITRSDDLSPGAHPVVVLSHSYWQRQFGSDASVIGRTVRVTGLPMTIIGVLPAVFTGLETCAGGGSADSALDAGRGAGRPVGLPSAINDARRRIRGDHRRSSPRRCHAGAGGAGPDAAAAALPCQSRVDAGRSPVRRDRSCARRAGWHGIGVARRQYQTSLSVLIAATTAVLLIACLIWPPFFWRARQPGGTSLRCVSPWAPAGHGSAGSSLPRGWCCPCRVRPLGPCSVSVHRPGDSTGLTGSIGADPRWTSDAPSAAVSRRDDPALRCRVRAGSGADCATGRPGARARPGDHQIAGCGPAGSS